MSPLHVPRKLRASILGRIRAAEWVKIVHVDEAIDLASWEYLLSRRDKDFSLVDCSSFVIMEKHGLRAALTTDKHFEQAGLLRLLK
jgi:predicted nucleic acid-binding protein